MNNILQSKATSYGFRSWFSMAKKSNPNYPLKNEKLWMAFEDAIKEAQYVDCIWFDGEKNMPAIFKVCDNNIIEGLCRLKNVKELIPPYFSKYYFVVEDDKYFEALDELSKPVFKNSEITILRKSELLNATLN